MTGFVLFMHGISFVFGFSFSFMHILAFPAYRYELILAITYIFITTVLRAFTFFTLLQKKNRDFYIPLLKHISIICLIAFSCYPILLLIYNMSCNYTTKINPEEFSQDG